MSDAAALLAAIRAAPDDDAPRLIYANWLEEHGQTERAEFIRIQCDLAGNDTAALKQRAAKLLAEHHDAFVGPLAAPGLRFRFHRGFIVGFGHTGLFVTDHDRATSVARTLRFSSTGRLADGLLGKPIEPLAFETTMGQLTEYLRTKYRGPVQRSFKTDGIDWEYSPRFPGTYKLDTLVFPAEITIKFQIEDMETQMRGSFHGASLHLEFHGQQGDRHLRQAYQHIHIPGFDSFQDSPQDAV